MKQSKIQLLYDKYGKNSSVDFDPKFMNQELTFIHEVNNKEDAKCFLELLSKLRTKQSDAIAGLGKGSMDMITNVFSGGDEGVYSADADLMNARFIYELVQNVDDCKYNNVNDCKLVMKFDIENDKLILEYNEIGFLPENVMAITGLGNSTKNHKKASNYKAESKIDQDDLLEIGEKGIGFKSIFGLAKSVNIKSRYFNFSINRENFFVPIVGNYADFEYTDCTILELTLFEGMAGELYRFLKSKYDHVDSIVNENPILFLNKLTEIAYYASENDFFGFKVTRDDENNDLTEFDVFIEYFSSDASRNRQIEATRFTKKIVYSIEECQSRYGNEEESIRKHKVVIIVPKDARLINEGRIYSFFATSEVINAPFIIHAPFKLNSGRTKIDSQSQSVISTNLWFKRTCDEVLKMVRFVYERIAQVQKENVIYYIPDHSLIGKGCVLNNELFMRDNILSWCIFEGVDGKFYAAKDICFIDYDAELPLLKKIHKILGINTVLSSIPYKRINEFENLSIRKYTCVNNRLLSTAINDKLLTAKCCEIINDFVPDFDLGSLSNFKGVIEEEQLIYLSKFKEITEWLNQHTIDYLVKGKKNSRISSVIKSRTETMSEIKTFCENFGGEINNNFIIYLNNVKYIKADVKNTIYTYDCIIGNNMLEDFASIYHMIDKKDKFFYPFLKMEAVSEEIDNLLNNNEDVSDAKFLELLSQHRLQQKKMLKSQYDNILNLIELSGTNSERFFPEILQNVDDCIYKETPKAKIYFKNINSDFKLYVEYNETGFTREQLRAITAIGDSTKKRLLSTNSTGEKGIGFKSVFALCSNVQIKSSSVSFELSGEAPTVPKNIKQIDKINGTVMIFTIKPTHEKSVIELLSNEKKIIKNCLCLKQLHNIQIKQCTLKISDIENRRIVSYGNHKIEFHKYNYYFNITNKAALNERQKLKHIADKQYITYLLPINIEYEEFAVYSTLPTLEKIKIPLIIDMPLQLDTARERISQGEWNRVIMSEMFKGLRRFYEYIAINLGTKIIQIIPLDGKVVEHNYGKDYGFTATLTELPLFKCAFEDRYIPLSEGVFTDNIEYMAYEKAGKSLDMNVMKTLLAKEDSDFDRMRRIFDKFLRKRTNYDICSNLDSLFNISNAKNDLIAKDKDFRSELYLFLAEIYDKRAIAKAISLWRIIPIRYQNKIKYIEFSQEIYTPGDQNIDSAKYKILDSQIMSEELFNNIYSRINGTYIPIRKFSRNVIISEFYDEIERCLQEEDETQRAYELLELYKKEKKLFIETHNTHKNISLDRVRVITKNKETVPLSKCFIIKAEQPQGCLDSVIVDLDYYELADLLGAKPLAELHHYKQLPFEIGSVELLEINSNSYIPNGSKQHLFISLYMSDGISEELSRKQGFFELYRLVNSKDRLNTNQPNRSVIVDDSSLKRFSAEINEISISEIPVDFEKHFDTEPFEKDSILTEVENELQLRKETNKVKTIISLISNCDYAEIGKKRIVAFRCKDRRKLLFSNKVKAEYDIIETLKKYLLDYFNTEVSVNRNINLYDRTGYEMISTIVSTNEVVKEAVKRLKHIDLDNILDVKNFLCKPLLINGVTYGGYAKTCPLCGARIDTELTGMRIYKTKCDGIIVPIISCSNCHENLRYSSNISVDIENLKDGKLFLQCQINDYKWKVENVIIRLGHRALIETLNKSGL